MQTLRDLQQMGRSAFMALSAAERDLLIYDALEGQTMIDIAILRDQSPARVPASRRRA